MDIITNKQITKLFYRENTPVGKRVNIVKNGEILTVMDLTSPMRGDDVGLSKKEPHVTFYNGTEGIFIPVVDIINIKYA